MSARFRATSWPRLEGLRVLVLDALRPQPHPAHFGLDQALDVIDQLQPEQAYLTHMSHELDHEDSERASAAERAAGLRRPAFRVLTPGGAPMLTVPDDLHASPEVRRPGTRPGRVGPPDGRRAPASCWRSCKALDLDQLARLYAERDHAYTPPSWDAIKPVPVVPADSPDNPR